MLNYKMDAKIAWLQCGVDTHQFGTQLSQLKERETEEKHSLEKKNSK